MVFDFGRSLFETPFVSFDMTYAVRIGVKNGRREERRTSERAGGKIEKTLVRQRLDTNEIYATTQQCHSVAVEAERLTGEMKCVRTRESERKNKEKKRRMERKVERRRIIMSYTKGSN